MADLVHLIYCSAASKPFSKRELAELLAVARHFNAANGITGMLLHAEGSFFQVLEGEAAVLDGLYAKINRDHRHGQVTLIIREPIAGRSFGDWTMGFADISPAELDEIVGANDFLTRGDSLVHIGPGRARKLLEAFREGRWRTALGHSGEPAANSRRPVPASEVQCRFAFQPIIHAGERSIFAYEALLRGPAGESPQTVLQQVGPETLHEFHERSRAIALEMAARLGLSCRLNLNLLPSSVSFSPTAVTSVLAAAAHCGISPGQIVLEILESDIVRNYGDFAAALNAYRASGLTFALDDFGSGYAGLNLLAEFQPDFVKLDMHLVRGIESHGPRQAIVRGIARTCLDLGIDLLAEGVETPAEYFWCRGEGIELFQGFLFARPALDQLPRVFDLPE